MQYGKLFSNKPPYHKPSSGLGFCESLVPPAGKAVSMARSGPRMKHSPPDQAVVCKVSSALHGEKIRSPPHGMFWGPDEYVNE